MACVEENSANYDAKASSDLKPSQKSESEPQLSLLDTKSTSKETASDSDSSSDSPSSSSPEEGNQRQLTGPFILNHFIKIAHLTKTKEGKMLPSCGARFIDEKLYRVSGEFPEDFDLCQHKGCMHE